jgi:hypothetical protein
MQMIYISLTHIQIGSRGSSVVQRWATSWMIGGFESRQGLVMFLLTTASIPALGTTQSNIQWVPGALSLELKQPGRETNHSPPSTASMAWCSITNKKHLHIVLEAETPRQVGFPYLQLFELLFYQTCQRYKGRTPQSQSASIH